MSQTMYGVVGAGGEYIEVSTSLHGAKIVASRGGYLAIGRRNVMTGVVALVARKNESGRWIDITF